MISRPPHISLPLSFPLPRFRQHCQIPTRNPIYMVRFRNISTVTLLIKRGAASSRPSHNTLPPKNPHPNIFRVSSPFHDSCTDTYIGVARATSAKLRPGPCASGSFVFRAFRKLKFGCPLMVRSETKNNLLY